MQRNVINKYRAA